MNNDSIGQRVLSFNLYKSYAIAISTTKMCYISIDRAEGGWRENKIRFFSVYCSIGVH